MSDSEVFLDYRGPVDFDIIDSILVKLKKAKEYKALNKVTAKRLYSLVVECLENICKHSELSLSENPELYSHLSVRNSDGRIIISSGNPVTLSEKLRSSTGLIILIYQMNQLFRHFMRIKSKVNLY